MSPEKVKAAIRTIRDFPKPGINFRDVPAIFEQPDIYAYVISDFADWCRETGVEALAGIDARGFVLAGSLATRLHLPMYIVRKKGKIPGETIGVDYDLEYGSATLEMPRHADVRGRRVAIIDDLLATGGTAVAAASLLRELGTASIQFGAVVNLLDLPGDARLAAENVPLKFICGFSESE